MPQNDDHDDDDDDKNNDDAYAEVDNCTNNNNIVIRLWVMFSHYLDLFQTVYGWHGRQIEILDPFMLSTLLEIKTPTH